MRSEHHVPSFIYIGLDSRPHHVVRVLVGRPGGALMATVGRRNRVSTNGAIERQTLTSCGKVVFEGRGSCGFEVLDLAAGGRRRAAGDTGDTTDCCATGRYTDNAGILFMLCTCLFQSVSH